MRYILTATVNHVDGRETDLISDGDWWPAIVAQIDNIRQQHKDASSFVFIVTVPKSEVQS